LLVSDFQVFFVYLESEYNSSIFYQPFIFWLLMYSTVFRCSKCNGQVSKETKVCPHCRALLSGIQCSRCHFIGSESSFFGDKCPKCGSFAISPFGYSGSGYSSSGYGINNRRSGNRSQPTISLSENVWPFFRKVFHATSCMLQLHKCEGLESEDCDKTKHTWSADNCEKCSVCGHTTNNAHKWKKCKCTVCGSVRDNYHDWSSDCNICNSCGAKRSDFHTWNGCSCSTCGKKNHFNHTWDTQKNVCSQCGISEIEALIANMFNLMKEKKYINAKNELDKIEAKYGSNIDLQLIRVNILIGMSRTRELSELEKLMGLYNSDKHNDLRTAYDIVQNIHDQSIETVLNTKRNLAVVLVNSGIEFINSNKPFIPYGACGDLVYEAKSKQRRACKEAIELVLMAMQLDPKNKKIIEIHSELSKLI